jgi:hypothetical protein
MKGQNERFNDGLSAGYPGSESVPARTDDGEGLVNQDHDYEVLQPIELDGDEVQAEEDDEEDDEEEDDASPT